MTRVGAMITRELPPEDVPRLAASVAPGLDELWVVEDLGWAGGITQVAAVLDATANDHAGRPRVGHGIAPAPFRNPAALAMEWAALARMHPGRLLPGIGHGLPEWMTRIGEPVGSPMTLLRETTAAVRALLRGESVTTHGRYVHLDGVQLEFAPPDPVPVYLGVRGPKGLRLAGEMADGTVLASGPDPGEIQAAWSTIDAGHMAADRHDHHDLVVFTRYFCGDPADLPSPPPDVTGGWAAVGADPAAAAEELQKIVDADADSVIVVPHGPFEEQLHLLVEEVVPLLDR